MNINKILLITMILLIAFTTSACNKSVTEPVEIHFQVPFPKGSDNPFEKPYLDAVANFHKLNPLITVTIDYNTESRYSVEKSIKLLESNEPPDIVPFLPSVISLVEKKGLLRDLLPLQESNGSKDIDINQRILDSAMINGKLLALPYAAFPSAVLYNKDLFDSAHIPYPQGDWTWEQFRDISKKLKLTGGPVLSYDTFTFNLLMASTGKGLLSPNGETSVGYLDSPEAIHALQWLNAYYHDDKEKTTPINRMDLFAQFDKHQIGMLISSDGFMFSTFEGSNKDKLGVAPLPHFEGGKRANPIFFDGYGISQKSKHPEAAWEFIKYLTLNKNEDSVKFNYYLTTSKSMAEATGQNSDPIKSIYSNEMNYAVKSSSDYNPFFNKAWNGDLTALFQKLLSAKSNDIPAKLHDLALKLDQEMKRLKNAEDQPTGSPSP